MGKFCSYTDEYTADGDGLCEAVRGYTTRRNAAQIMRDEFYADKGVIGLLGLKEELIDRLVELADGLHISRYSSIIPQQIAEGYWAEALDRAFNAYFGLRTAGKKLKEAITGATGELTAVVNEPKGSIARAGLELTLKRLHEEERSETGR